jgi:hypothetical protein
VSGPPGQERAGARGVGAAQGGHQRRQLRLVAEPQQSRAHLRDRVVPADAAQRALRRRPADRRQRARRLVGEGADRVGEDRDVGDAADLGERACGGLAGVERGGRVGDDVAQSCVRGPDVHLPRQVGEGRDGARPEARPHLGVAKGARDRLVAVGQLLHLGDRGRTSGGVVRAEPSHRVGGALGVGSPGEREDERPRGERGAGGCLAAGPGSEAQAGPP